jgi:hypothetical protein
MQSRRAGPSPALASSIALRVMASASPLKQGLGRQGDAMASTFRFSGVAALKRLPSRIGRVFTSISRGFAAHWTAPPGGARKTTFEENMILLQEKNVKTLSRNPLFLKYLRQFSCANLYFELFSRSGIRDVAWPRPGTSADGRCRRRSIAVTGREFHSRCGGASAMIAAVEVRNEPLQAAAVGRRSGESLAPLEMRHFSAYEIDSEPRSWQRGSKSCPHYAG